ncbi:DUF1236 domain-containing protein [Mesorhizobium sp. PAMC28654]|jgi:hypothetical protein|uniref:DUF1236 domain-containing protein n=1 Tax=Mesorhizobium sp. PAMC28654 TaxID=2880934 RepID=UPI001D09DB94|nr:DUF1236 domain-containing protein [Mesorhizobium sp. PAMC28654]UDL87679.1 DUF1236 domain-containing protein [Mesorhizobium sp. PAMC28654]
MKTHLSVAAAGILLLAGVGIASAETIIIKPEQETVIREYVKKKPLVSLDLPGVELNLGSKLPDTVELHRIDVPDVRYQYVVVGGRTYLVDPDTHEIVQEIEQ